MFGFGTVLLLIYEWHGLQFMLGSGVPSVVGWLVLAWLLAVGLFMALLYASGERDQHKRARV